MIYDSPPWKTQLLRDATLIERLAAEPRRSESRSFRIERRVFLAAYTMRKLDEALRVSTSTLGNPIRVLQFNSREPGYSTHNSFEVDRYFDLKQPRVATLPRRRLLNLLIHSLGFVEVTGRRQAYEGFMVTSDRESQRGLYQVSLADYTALMREVGRDYPSAMCRAFDVNRERWVTWAGHGSPPPDVVERLQAALATHEPEI